MPEPERKLSALDRAVLQAVGDARKVGKDDDPAAKKYPDVWQWLTKTDAPGGYVFQPADIRLQLGPEGVLVTLTHRDLCKSVSVPCPHIGLFLDALQAALTSENVPIRSWGKSEPRLRKKRT